MTKKSPKSKKINKPSSKPFKPLPKRKTQIVKDLATFGIHPQALQEFVYASRIYDQYTLILYKFDKKVWRIQLNGLRGVLTSYTCFDIDKDDKKIDQQIFTELFKYFQGLEYFEEDEHWDIIERLSDKLSEILDELDV